MERGQMFKINDLVWIKQSDVDKWCWVLGRVKGFTPKMIKCENLTRGDATQNVKKVGNFKPTNIKLITKKEIIERGFSKSYIDKNKS